MIPDDALVTATWDDLIERDGQALALSGNDVSLLSELATAAVLFCAEGDATVSAIAAHLEELFGAPEGADTSAAVREVLTTLQNRGVVSITG
ncbi:hypothetical protein QQX10_08480 [Demequina sp. SYSU T00039]|uniref:Coenzyme PQQ synthesis protein D (PqqD) n=1 Tax=Demequina lignilytica TaxID=3051663 RepID=A0AAW7M9C1_9MICO|nr:MULTISPECIES: hypothetical protein [unclassified Demequina]MDN4477448.1 hypothetical protein [Demequina sp. SYSU T00039-1]MDN4488201.1 hypothetical protein [Demequina sp. SYSU T00039]